MATRSVIDRDDEETRFIFTKPKLEALPAPLTGQKTYFDTKPGVRGLILLVTQNRVKTFYVRRRSKGEESKRILVGRFPDVSVEQARRKAEEINGNLALGIDPTAKSAALREEPTLEKLFEVYLEEPRKRGGTRTERTVSEYKKLFDSYLKPYHKKKLSTLTHDALSELTRAVATKNGKYASNRLLGLVKALYNFAIDRKKLKVENPAIGIVAQPETSRDRRLWPDELAALFKVLDTDAPADLKHFVYLALLTGARRWNLLTMEWDDVLLLERRIWRIRQTKNGQPQNVALVDEAVEILQARLDVRSESKYVFPGNGASGHLTDVMESWGTALKRAGIKDLRLHDLRRTLASYQADAGVPLDTIGRTLNHLSSTATKIYARMAMDPVRQAMQAGTGAMLKAAGRERKQDQTAPKTQVSDVN